MHREIVTLDYIYIYTIFYVIKKTLPNDEFGP